jgi:NDP-sugar pyrophosphorylase family protein
MKALLLSAGRGERLRPYSKKVAKPALPFLQLPMLAYSAELFLRAGVDGFIFNLFHRPESVKSVVSSSPLREIVAGYSEEATLLGSGGGLLQASPHFGDQPYWLMGNADEIFLPESPTVLKSLMEAHETSGSFATLLVQKHPEAGSTFGGVWVNEQGLVAGFGRDKKAYPKTSPWHYLGFMAVSPDVTKYLPPLPQESNILYDGLTRALATGREVRIYHAPGIWGETGNITSYLETTERVLELLPTSQYLQELRARWGLQSCPLEHLPTGAKILGGKNSTVSAKGLVKNFLVLGDDVTVGPQVSLNRVVIQGPQQLEGPLSLQNTLVV